MSVFWFGREAMQLTTATWILLGTAIMCPF
jgi:hypothetical protein